MGKGKRFVVRSLSDGGVLYFAWDMEREEMASFPASKATARQFCKVLNDGHAKAMVEAEDAALAMDRKPANALEATEYDENGGT